MKLGDILAITNGSQEKVSPGEMSYWIFTSGHLFPPTVSFTFPFFSWLSRKKFAILSVIMYIFLYLSYPTLLLSMDAHIFPLILSPESADLCIVGHVLLLTKHSSYSFGKKYLWLKGE